METSSFDITKTLFWQGLLKTVRLIMITCSAVSTGCIIYSVILRYIFKANFYGSDEIILLFAFWLYFIGAVHGSFENSHIRADLLNMYVKNMRAKDLIELIAQLITIAVGIVLLIWAFDYFLWGLEKMPRSTGLKIPLVIPQSVLFFGLLLMSFYHLVYFVRNIRAYVTYGFFSKPQDRDYVTARFKAKFPATDAPLKEEVKRMAAAEKQGEGGVE